MTFEGWHIVIAMIAASVITASFAPTPHSSDQWIYCDEFDKDVGIPYKADINDYGALYWEPVGGWEDSPGSNMLFSSDKINFTHGETVSFKFKEWIRVDCKNGEVSVDTLYISRGEVEGNVRNRTAEGDNQ